LSVDQDLVASDEDSLGCTLQVDGKLFTIGSDESIELDVRAEWNDGVDLFTRRGLELEDFVLFSLVVQVHERLAELNKSSLGSISLTVSGGVEHAPFSNSESGLHLSHDFSREYLAFEGCDRHLFDSGVELLALLIGWVIVEDSVGSKDY
jgi:hypothetical protein